MAKFIPIKILTLDIGNNSIKWGIFHHNVLKKNGAVSEYNDLIKLKSKYNAIVCVEVALKKYGFRNADSLKEKLTQDFDTKVFIYNTPQLLTLNLPFDIDYKNINIMGADRLVGMYYIAHYYANQNAVIIDIGTCITIDFINDKNQFVGGIISPGLKMRYKAIGQFTEKIPIEDTIKIPFDINNRLGKSTLKCVSNGCYYGILNELNECICTFVTDYNVTKVILTGGDAKYFENKIMNKAILYTNFVVFDENIILKSLVDIFLCHE